MVINLLFVDYWQCRTVQPDWSKMLVF